MSTITIVIQHALRFAGAAMTEDMSVQVNLEDLLTEFMECGLQVRACGMALDDCAIDEASMITGIERGSMKALAAWVKQSDQVMVF